MLFSTLEYIQIALDNVSRVGLSILCWHATPATNSPKNISEFVQKVKFYILVGNKAMN